MILELTALGVIVTSIAAGGLADGFNDKGKKNLGHAIETVEKGSLVMSPFLLMAAGAEPRMFLAYGISYLLLRASTFDLFYNVARGNKIGYVGKTGLWGKIVSKIPPHGRWWIRSIFLIAGLGIPFSFF